MAPFRIQDLPGELRNKIYGQLPLSDRMTLLRTSRFINCEVSPLFFTIATYRILVNVDFIPSCTNFHETWPLPPHIKDNIQNIDVYWELFGNEERKEGDVEASSWDPHISRRRCRIFFGYFPDGSPLPASIRDGEFGQLKTLAGFETVELRMGLKELRQLQSHHTLFRDPRHRYTASDSSYPTTVPMYERLANGLQSVFGAAELNLNWPDHCVLFQPRRHSANSVDKL